MQLKKCKHIGCTNYPSMGCGGYCREHQTEDVAYERKQIASQRKAIVRKEAAKLRKEFNPKALSKGVDAELEKYFADAAKELEMKPYCENCGSRIPTKFFRAATAHLIPKSLFPSVKSHPLNRMFLGAGCGCHTKSERTDLIPTLKCYPEIKGKLLDLFPLVKEKHKYLTLLKEMVQNN